MRRRLPLALLWPTGLVLLVGVLAFFQYTWLGQVSEAERSRLRTTLNQRAREFADDFDRDIGRAYTSLQMSDDTVEAKDWETFAKRYDQWKEAARFPQLIRTIYLTADQASAEPLLQFDPAARTFRSATWPPDFEPVKQRIQPFNDHVEPPPGLPGALRFVALPGSPIVPAVPAILVPVQSAQYATTASPSRGNIRAFRPGPAFIVLELDRGFMVNTMLPSLVERHFAVDDYHVAVTDGHSAGPPIFTKGLAAGTTIRQSDADATTPFFGIRMDGFKDAIAALKPVAGAAAVLTPSDTTSAPSASAPGQVSIVVQQGRAGVETMRTANVQYGDRGAWQIVLQHPAGSLEAAVSRARVRNLSLSFGVLAVLAAGVFLITINAQRAERLAAQQIDFVATVSHELRTPLAVIRSAAQNLSAGVVHEPGQARRYGELIDGEGRRLTDMIEQVLTYAGLSGRRPLTTTAPTDVVAFAQEVVASWDALIRDAGFTVDVTAAGDVPSVLIDEGMFRSALNNLIANALKYGAGGSWLGVDVRLGAGKSGKKEVRVSVSDRGRGIDPPDLPHIFDAFYRGQYAKDRQIHGNGLGLSLVERIAEAHGGRVSVTSTPGAGATFTLHLPA
jgi:signal transduction histidine kinase